MLKMLSGLFARMAPKPDVLARAERAARREAKKRGIDKAVRRLALKYGDCKRIDRWLCVAGLGLRADPCLTGCCNDLIAQVELVYDNGDRVLVYRHTPSILEYRRRGEWEHLLGEAAEEIALDRIGGE